MTVAIDVATHWHDANGNTQEDSMENKMVQCKMVRDSFLSITEAIGTAVMGDLLAA